MPESEKRSATVTATVPPAIANYLKAYASAIGHNATVSDVLLEVLTRWEREKPAVTAVEEAAHRTAEELIRAGFPNNAPYKQSARASPSGKPPRKTGTG